MTSTNHFGVVVFSHLRLGLCLAGAAVPLVVRAKAPSPLLRRADVRRRRGKDSELRVEMHAVTLNVAIAYPHAPKSMSRSRQMPPRLCKWTRAATEYVNENCGALDQPLLWYHSPMDSTWLPGHFGNCGVVYDCIDELSQFTGAPKRLTAHEARLMGQTDIVFTGGYELGRQETPAALERPHPSRHRFHGPSDPRLEGRGGQAHRLLHGQPDGASAPRLVVRGGGPVVKVIRTCFRTRRTSSGWAPATTSRCRTIAPRSTYA